MTFDCYYGPELPNCSWREESPAAGIVLRFPVLEPEDVLRICSALRSQRDLLRAVPSTHMIAAIDRAAALLRDPAHELGAAALALLPLVTGYSPAMSEHVLVRMAQDWTATSLRTLVSAEFGSSRPLDGFAPVDGRRSVRAYGADLTAHFFSGNVPGVNVTSLVRALLVKSPSFGKMARGEPILPVLFARALAASDARLSGVLACTHWQGGDVRLEQPLLAAADLVVVYGSGPAGASIRERLPHEHRLVVHGPKLSIGFVHCRAVHEPPLATAVARAVATFDQQGCVSPHSVFVVGGAVEDARALAAALADALLSVEAELPRGQLTAEEAVAIRNTLAEAEFRAMADGNVEILTPPHAPAAVVFDRSPELRPSCLNRLVYVQHLRSADAIERMLLPHRHLIQSVAIAGFTENEAIELVDRLASAGTSRITTFQRLPWPPPEWHHDGAAPLRELTRFVDWEL